MPYDEPSEVELVDDELIGDEPCSFNEPFAPVIQLRGCCNLFILNLDTGVQTSRTEPCLICATQLRDGHAVIIDNGYGDKMEAGFYCFDHDLNPGTIIKAVIENTPTLLRRKADTIAKAGAENKAYLLRQRADAIAALDPTQLAVVQGQ